VSRPLASLPRKPHALSTEEVRALIGPVPEPMLLDIGANDGSDSRRLAEAFPHAHVHAFECDARALARFRATPLPPNVTLHAFAIGARDGRATFHVSGGTNPSSRGEPWDLSGSLKKPTGHKERFAWCTFDTTQEVEVRRLDRWLADHRMPRVDFVWLDVQGGEADVIEGGKRTLLRTRYLYTEFNAWKKPLYDGDLTLDATLHALGPGWTPLALYEGYNVLLRNEAAEHPGAHGA
jgi:2-O-methyltransferase